MCIFFSFLIPTIQPEVEDHRLSEGERKWQVLHDLLAFGREMSVVFGVEVSHQL